MKHNQNFQSEHIISMCVCVSLFRIVATSKRREEIRSFNFIYTYGKKITEFEMTFDTQSKWEWHCRQKFDWSSVLCMEWSGVVRVHKRIMYSVHNFKSDGGNLIERRLQVRNCLTSAKYDCT